MAQLIVRNIEDAVVEALKREAARHGHSAEAEHREILRRHLMKRPRRNLKSHLLAMPDAGEDRDFEVERSAARRVDL
jgi:plasmid stability protein